MKLAVATLNRYFKQSRSTEQIIALLGRTEIEVEAVLPGVVFDPKIVLVRVQAVTAHPGADRLRLVSVETGSGIVEVVCGASNVSIGMQAALVQVGAQLPDGTVIEASTIRGQVSQGMLASGLELGLNDDHGGILDLTHLTDRLGSSLCDIMFSGDILDIKTPANRWDYLSGVGVARELAAFDDLSQTCIEPATKQYTYKDIEEVDVKARGGCRRFVSAHLRLKNDVQTPAWIVDNLEANGFVSHSPVVDITNFVMLETGQPSHAYDLKKLTTPLTVRAAEAGEKFAAINGKEILLSSEDVIVADARGPIGLAGVMGGANTEISSDTTEIILEAANWDKTSTRRSSLRHGLRTEASARFERGLPLPLSQMAFGRLLQLLEDICVAEVISGPFDQLYAWPWRRFLGLRMRRAEKIIGTSIDEKMMVAHFERLGFRAEHFSLTNELRSHLGKPYIWGANFRAHRETGFDCSYLVDRIYSKLGVQVGHTALGQFHHGQPVELDQLKPGDVLFIEGKIEKSVTDHYYTTSQTGEKTKHTLKTPLAVGHNGIYIGGGKVIQASQYQRQDSNWIKREVGGVIETDVREFVDDAGYLGARRYVASFNHLIAIEVPWWRTDITQEIDLIEEVGKAVGYQDLGHRLPQQPVMPSAAQSLLLDQMQLRQSLVSHGLTEISTYSFVSAREADAIRLDIGRLLPVANPRSPEQAFLRSTLLTSHLRLWASQAASVPSQTTVFEISRVFEARGGDLPQERTHVGFSALGSMGLERLQALLHRLAAQDHIKLEYRSIDQSQVFIPQQTAQIVLPDGTEIGMIGQIRPSLARQFDLDKPIAWCELDIKQWLLARPTDLKLKTTPAYQLVERDISLEVSDTTWCQVISGAITAMPSVWSVTWLDQFQDEKLLKENKRVLTFRILIDLGERPKLDQINSTLDKIIIQLSDGLADQDSIAVR